MALTVTARRTVHITYWRKLLLLEKRHYHKNSINNRRCSLLPGDDRVTIGSKTAKTTIKTIQKQQQQQQQRLNTGKQQQRPPSTPLTECVLPPVYTPTEFAETIRPHYESQTPVIVRGGMSQTDAVHCWKDYDYLIEAVGEHTLCDVEMGRSYDRAQRVTIPFGEYVQYIKLYEERYDDNNNNDHNNENSAENLTSNDDEIVYLAQNDIFPTLLNDFNIPDFCQNGSYNVGLGHMYNVMVWFGPKGCVSPLHYDPLDNLLIQFVGNKRVKLFPPQTETRKPMEEVPTTISNDQMEEEQLCHHQKYQRTPEHQDHPLGCYYAGYNGRQLNTSAVDVENPDLNQYPAFANAPPALEALLCPGDILFIPSKWWHHVRSLDTSLSVNVWWR